LSSGFSQYQHEPLGGNICRVCAAVSGLAVPERGMPAPSSGTLSCIGSTLLSFPACLKSDARLLQRNWRKHEICQRLHETA
jgi:hypothetical protein